MYTSVTKGASGKSISDTAESVGWMKTRRVGHGEILFLPFFRFVLLNEETRI